MHVWFLGVASLLLWGSGQALAAPVMIQLTQTACQFVEAEHQDYGFQSKNSADCVAINEHTEEKRLALSQTLHLKAGSYVFRVKNRDVPYVLGFWLRGQGLGRLTLPSVSGGNIQTGGFKDYAITLKKGAYLYSCPLNPTPDYRLLVE
ncbi:MAG: hypothetical protein COB41_08655 [Proteobacteria bacterium]|nr:MAG: hypothetical protein COB41_08655 [Pseudomonadota bacterium]